MLESSAINSNGTGTGTHLSTMPHVTTTPITGIRNAPPAHRCSDSWRPSRRNRNRRLAVSRSRWGSLPADRLAWAHRSSSMCHRWRSLSMGRNCRSAWVWKNRYRVDGAVHRRCLGRCLRGDWALCSVLGASVARWRAFLWSLSLLSMSLMRSWGWRLSIAPSTCRCFRWHRYPVAINSLNSE